MKIEYYLVERSTGRVIQTGKCHDFELEHLRTPETVPVALAAGPVPQHVDPNSLPPE